MYNQIFKKIGVDTEKDQDYKLLKKPAIKKNEYGKFMIPTASICQADVVYMPKDGNFDYILSLISIAGKKFVDAEPMTGRTSEHILQALEAIFKRKYIKKENCKYLYCDQGTEFKNQVIEDYCNRNNIIIRFTRAGRKNQTGMVEYLNFIITKLLGSKMTVEEARMEQVNSDWVRHLPVIIKELNEYKKDNTKELKIKDFFKPPLLKDTNEIDLKIGDYVHIILEKAPDGSNRFRNGDQRYTNDVYKIVHISTYPNQPVRYMVEDFNNVSFIRKELLKATDTMKQQKQFEENAKKLKKEQKEHELKNDTTKRPLELRSRTAYI